MLTKSCAFSVKSAGEAQGLADGEFEAVVSVFGNVDSYGDVVMPGAFADTLAEYADKGAPIPIWYSHRMDDPNYLIGEVKEAAELMPGDERLPESLKELGGLWVKGSLDITDAPPGSRALSTWRAMTGRRITQFSFAYDILDGGPAKRETPDGKSEDYYELRKLKLYEVGPTPVGANSATELLAIKTLAERAAGDLKSGRVLSAKNQSAIKSAYSALAEVLEALDSTNDSDDDASETAETDPEDHRPANGPPDGKGNVLPDSSVSAYLAAIAISEKEIYA